MFLTLLSPEQNMINIQQLLLMKGKVNKGQTNHTQCTICMQRNSNTQLDGCLHQFCIRCIKKWSKTKNTCPLCRERFHSLKYHNRNIQIEQTPVNIRPRLSLPLGNQPLRRIFYVPMFVYSATNCLIYPGNGGYLFGQSMEQNSGVNYPLNATFFMPAQ